MNIKLPKAATPQYIRALNNKLDRLDTTNTEEVFAIGNTLHAHHLHRTMPAGLIDALISKFTAILDGSWYGDEPEEYTIRRYI